MPQIEMLLKNIGPHNDVKYKSKANQIKMVVYGRNGVGKTYLSRAFRLFRQDDVDVKEHVKNLIPLNSKNSEFHFKIDEKYAKFRIINNELVEVENNLDRKFHVFNSDYIYENFTSKNYVPNSLINGYILGKVNIDLRKEKEELEKIKFKGTDIKDKIEKEIVKSKDNLKQYKITNNLNACKRITYETLLRHEMTDIDMMDYINKYIGLINLPDEIEDVRLEMFDGFEILDIQEIEHLLKTEYTLSYFENHFKQYVKNNLTFIERGISLYDDKEKICPFCHQELNDEGLNLVNKYIEFVNDKETIVIKKLNQFIESIKMIKNKVKEYLNKLNYTNNNLKLIDNYFGPFSFNCIENLEQILVEYINNLDEINIVILSKIDNIKQSYELNYNKNLKNLFRSGKEIFDVNVKLVNDKKNKISKLKTNYKNIICEGLLNKLKKEFNSEIQKINILKQKAIDLQKLISEKEMINRKSRKELVAEDFENYLKIFFGDKYQLDKSNFTLSLNSKYIGDKVNKVLSEGERNILVFCYFLASIHEIVSTEEDYNKVILIIDDPVSSIDIQYCYQVVSLIKKYFNDNAHPKYIIFTHNLEFFNILQRNMMVTKKLILDKGKGLYDYKNDLLMPYEFHLNDIFKVAENNVEPGHTIPNSIRHVIETICHFEGYTKDSTGLYDFIRSKHEFKDNEEIYTFMQDLSHGNFRFDIAYSSETIIKGCKAVIEFMKNQYPLQIERLTNRVKSDRTNTMNE